MIPRLFPTLVALNFLVRSIAADPPAPHPANDLNSARMLAGDWVPADPQRIDFASLPRVPSQLVVVSDVRAVKGVNQHNYLAFHGGRYWVMWSDGPAIEDRVGQRVKFATSQDGLKWGQPQFLTPEAPGSGKDSPWYGTRSPKGFRWIARGFWPRTGELLALASLDEADGFFGPSLELRSFRWNASGETWDAAGVVFTNTINNFPPQKLPTGEWMISRRTHDYKRTGVQFLIGGHRTLNGWESFPVPGSSEELAAEEPDWWALPDGTLMALFRDNRRSGFLYRSFSTDHGRTWGKPVRTDFPDARSKFNGLRLSNGRYVLVSNPNPLKRDPLAISVSDDGKVFTRMGYLVGGRVVDYPHVMEHDGYLFVAFAGGKQSVEVLRIRLADLDELKMTAPAGKPQ